MWVSPHAGTDPWDSPLQTLQLPPFPSRNAQPQRVQLDEAFGVFLIIRALVFFKGGDLFVEQGVVRLPADYVHVAFVEFQANGAVHVGLGLVDQGLQSLTLR